MPTLIIGAIVFLIIGFAAYSTFRDKKANSCGGGCAGCSKGKCN